MQIQHTSKISAFFLSFSFFLQRFCVWPFIGFFFKQEFTGKKRSVTTRFWFNVLGRSNESIIFFPFSSFFKFNFCTYLLLMKLGGKIRRPTSRRMVLWRHLVRPFSWSFTFRRWQSKAIVREGQTWSLPYSSFCTAWMSVSSAWHDRSQSRETNDGKFWLLIFFLVLYTLRICVVLYWKVVGRVEGSIILIRRRNLISIFHLNSLYMNRIIVAYIVGLSNYS